MYRNLCMIAVLRLTTSKIYYRFISFPLEDAPIWNILLFFYDNILLLYYAKIHSLAADCFCDFGRKLVNLSLAVIV